jgi:catechol 2,3-dioxygenase-like lactoylglutathione lyase family enzyme
VAPVFPVSDLAAALAYYRGLGFGARQWHGGGYGFVAFDGAEIHLGVEEIRDNLVARIAEAEREGWTGEA